jgi:hypothetical protein
MQVRQVVAKRPTQLEFLDQKSNEMLGQAPRPSHRPILEHPTELPRKIERKLNGWA